MSKSIEILTGARVTLSVEVEGVGTWGPECTINQVHEQAATTAISRLQNILNADPRKTLSIKIIGTPKVDAIIVTRLMS